MPALLALLLTLDMQGVKPRHLQESGLLIARSGERAAVVDTEGYLWMGEGRLKKVAKLSTVPTGMALTDELALWTVSREGLWTRSRLQLIDDEGEITRDEWVDGPVSDVLSYEGGYALALPGAVLLLPDKGETKAIPLPFLTPSTLAHSDGRLRVHADSGEIIGVDLSTGCPTVLPDQGEPLTRLLRARSAAVCDPDITLPPEIKAAAEAARQAAIEGAIAARAPALLAGLGVRGERAVLSLAPAPPPGYPGFARQQGESVRGNPAIFGPKGAVVLQDFEQDLRGWAEGRYAPACVARLVLSSTDEEHHARNIEALASVRQARESCADSVVVAAMGSMDDTLNASTLRYVSSAGDLLARRVGPAGPIQVRLDIASLTPQGDPLTVLGKLPSYNYEWIVPAVRPRELVLQEDGSALAAAGWELVRVSPSGKRVTRWTLPGPVSNLSLRPSGEVDAVVGGQAALIDLDARRARWFDPVSNLSPAPAPVRDPGRWSFDGVTLNRKGNLDLEPVSLTLPVGIRSVATAGDGAIVETTIGLVGVDRSGKLVWRMPDTGAWIVTGDQVIVGTTQGIVGFPLPR